MKNIKYISVIALVAVLAFAFTWPHDFHTSTTKVEHNPGSNALNFTSKFITEDLEAVVGVSADNQQAFDAAVSKYLKSNFKVKLDGTPKSYNYHKAQTSPKATRLYFEIPNVQGVSSIEITNTMLIKEFPEQQNFVTFDINGKRASFVTKQGSPSGKANF